MFEADSLPNNVFAFKRPMKVQQVNLKEILENPDVREFYKFVYEQDLRTAALEAIKMKLAPKK